MNVTEIIVPTGEIIVREFTEEELAQREKDLQSAKLKAKVEVDRQNLRLELLERLGLTEDEAKVLLG